MKNVDNVPLIFFIVYCKLRIVYRIFGVTSILGTFFYQLY